MKTVIIQSRLTDLLARYAEGERRARRTDRKTEILTSAAKTADKKKVRTAVNGSNAGQRIETAFFLICSPLVLGCILFALFAP